jgi:hypothetical protein
MSFRVLKNLIDNNKQFLITARTREEFSSIRYVYYSFGFSELQPREILDFCVRLDIANIICGPEVVWSGDDDRCTLIQRAWRKYRNKEHKYFGMQAIAEYFGHPKRIQLEV